MTVNTIIEVILGVCAVVFQFLAAYFGYTIYKYNRLSKWWLALVAAFIIQGLRRVITVFDDLGNSLFVASTLLDRILMFVISLLIVLGLWAMLKNFQNFEVIATKTRDKVAKMKK